VYVTRPDAWESEQTRERDTHSLSRDSFFDKFMKKIVFFRKPDGYVFRRV
jgi:hypothetical protein